MEIRLTRVMTGIGWFAVMLWLWSAQTPALSAAEESGKLNYSIQPYLWLPTLEADLKFSAPNGTTGEPEVSVDPDDYLENLDAAVIVSTDIRKGKWLLAADFVYMEVSSSDSSVRSIDFGRSAVSTELDIGTDVDTKSFITTFGGGYQVVDLSWLQMDLIAGARYLWIEADLDWELSGEIQGPENVEGFARSGSHTEDADVWNGIGGLKGRFRLGDGRWSIPFYADVGTGDSDVTWQIYTALGYAFSDRFDMTVGYRHLEFDGDDDQLFQELKLSGPVLGARFSF